MRNTKMAGRAKTLLASLPIVAQALARERQVTLVFGNGYTAATNGREIFLPRLPIPQSDDDSAALERLAVLAYGYLDHEVGHVIDTDFTVGEEAHHFGLLNAIEDPRQEVVLIQRYPGTRRTLDALSRVLIESDAQGVSPDMAPTDLVSFTAHAWLRVRLREELDFQPIADQGMALIRERLGAGVQTRLAALLTLHGLSMTSTLDALDLANSIVEMLRDEQERAEQPPQETPPEDTSNDDTDSDTSASNGDAETGQRGAAEGEPSGGSDGDAAEAGACQGEGQGTDSLTNSQKQALADAVSGAGAQGFKDRGDTALQEIEQVSIEVAQQGPVSYTQPDRISPGGHDEGTKPMTGGPLDTHQAAQVSARLRQRLNVLMEAKARVPLKVRDRGRKLSGRHLANVALGDPRVFEHRSAARQRDTAVLLLQDVSSSMRGAPIAIANGALYAGCRALHSLRGVKCAAMAFPGNGVVKRFEQPPVACERNFGLQAHGGTPLYEALLAAGRLLSARREPRKLLIVLTDGEPADSISASASAVIDALPRLGIEVYGIGICHDAVTGLFSNAEVIHDLEALPGALIGLLQQQLLAA